MLILIELKEIWILITLLRLIWPQTEFRLDPNKLKRMLCVLLGVGSMSYCVCTNI